MVCILTFLYALGKLNHLSPLLLILLFGLILNNKEVFFRGYLTNLVKKDDALSHVLLDEFKVVTIEASFFIRTVFFVLFGMSIALDTLWDPLVLTITGMVLAVLYIVRYLNLKVFTRTSIYPELFIAPRGLITILLFYAIPENLRSPEFDTGILLLTIIGTSLIMMLSLMLSGSADSLDDVEEILIDHPAKKDVVHMKGSAQVTPSNYDPD
jgi:NhaP-type Na+/H+ or K+/H+ antiporter